MGTVYGKIRKSDLRVVEQVIGIFRKRHLRAGLHGTSIWNPHYRDIDLLVVFPKKPRQEGVENFRKGLVDLQKNLGARVIGMRGDETAGLDYDIRISKAFLHISYVVLL